MKLVLITAVVLTVGISIGILYEKSTITICDAGTEIQVNEMNEYPAWQYDCSGEIVIVID